MKELNIRNQEAFQEEIQKSKQELLDQLSCLKEHCEAKVNDIVDKQKTTEADLAQIRAELKKHCEMVDSNCKDLDCKQKESVSSLANLLAYVKTLDTRFGGYEANQTAIENKISEINQTIDTHLIVKLVRLIFLTVFGLIIKEK
jgi:chromosome segregation ATPase